MSASNVSASWPVAASQTLITPSLPPKAMRRPSGLNAMLMTWRRSCRMVSASWPVAASQTLTMPTGRLGGDAPAVRAKCHAIDAEGGLRRSVSASRPVAASQTLINPREVHRGDAPAVRAERHAV